jgi:hypothetical protein
MMKQTTTPRPGRTSQSTRKLLPSSVVHPSSAAGAISLTEAPVKHTESVVDLLGAAVGVGPNTPVAEWILARFNSILPGKTDVAVALFMLAELRPANMLEAMLTTQMVGVHEAALGFLRNSTEVLSEEGRDQNVSRATRLLRLFSEQLEQLQRLKGTTRQQKVIVEHVYVDAGGQAIVGAVGAPQATPHAAEPTRKLLPRPGGKKENGRMTP